MSCADRRDLQVSCYLWPSVKTLRTLQLLIYCEENIKKAQRTVKGI